MMSLQDEYDTWDMTDARDKVQKTAAITCNHKYSLKKCTTCVDVCIDTAYSLWYIYVGTAKNVRWKTEILNQKFAILGKQYSHMYFLLPLWMQLKGLF